jgi:hypothetical protein
LAEFADEYDFENQVIFEPALDSSEIEDPSWKSLTIRYDPAKRPLAIERNVGDPLMHEEIKEILSILNISRESKGKQRVADHLKATTQTVSIEVGLAGLTDDAWEMVDGAEAFLARTYDGIVYDSDGRFFDSRLKQFYRL